MKLPNASEMRGLDKSAIEKYHIPGIVLMENAGLGTVRMMEKKLGDPENSFTLIFIGPGNNGGDGLVIGRHLHQRGCKPIFFFLVDPDKLTSDAAANMDIVQKLKIPSHIINSSDRVKILPLLYKQFINQGSCYAIVDAIFGIGLRRPVTGHFAESIQFINNTGSVHDIPVIAVDIPSGLSSDNGRILGSSVRADYTATYGCQKPGHVLQNGPECCGKTHIIDIGIPPEVLDRAQITTELIDRETAATIIAPLKRSDNVHKGSHGHLAVLAGSIGKTGAAILAVKAAMKTGTGLISLFTPENLNAIYESQLIEAMTIPLPSSISFLNSDDLAFIEERVKGKKALILGPGLGTDPATSELVLNLYKTVELPMVLDADALNIIAENRDSLAPAAGPRIFTPHPGEMSRLLGCSIKELQDNRVKAAETGCRIYSKDRNDCIMILKGTGTVVTSSGGITHINTSGNPGMATGGMGDVLTGIIGALLCQNLSPGDASVAGVYLHGMAGDKLYEQNGFGYTATELIDKLPLCLSCLLRQ